MYGENEWAYCSTGWESLLCHWGTEACRLVTEVPIRSRSRQPAGKRVALAILCGGLLDVSF